MAEVAWPRYRLDWREIIAEPGADVDQVVLSILQSRGAPIEGTFHLKVSDAYLCIVHVDPINRCYEYEFQLRSAQEETTMEMQKEGFKINAHKALDGGSMREKPLNEKEKAFKALLEDAEARRQFNGDFKPMVRVEGLGERKWVSRIASAIIFLIMVLGTTDLILIAARIILLVGRLVYGIGEVETV